MPTDIELAYLDQGYVLPEGLTWAHVAEHRARWEIDPVFVPLARVPGACIGWGIPFVNGVPLEHPLRGSSQSPPGDTKPVRRVEGR